MAQLTCQRSIDLQNLKHDSIFVKASDLQYEEGNWEKNDDYAELKTSCTFKVSGDCHLTGLDRYKAEFVIELAEHHTMGKAKTQLSPPKQESEVDLTDHSSGTKESIDLGVCDGQDATFSLTSAEPFWKLQKGLIIYGVNFTPTIFK